MNFAFYFLLTTFYLRFFYLLPPPASAILKALQAGLAFYLLLIPAS